MNHTTIEYNIPIRVKHFSVLSDEEIRRIKLDTLNLWSGHLFELVRHFGCSMVMQDSLPDDVGGALETLGVLGTGLSEAIETEIRSKVTEKFADESALNLANKINELPAEYKNTVLRLVGGAE